MKNVKKLLALLLALAMLFAFCACSNSNDKDDDKDDKKEGTSQSDKKKDENGDKNDNDDNDDKDDKLTESKLEGEWEATLDLSALIPIMGEDVAIFDELGIVIGDCTLDIVFKGGEATLKMDGLVDWYVEVMEDIIDWCYEGDNMLEYVAAIASMEGEEYTVEELEAMLAEEGMTVDDLLDEYFGEMDLDEMAEELADSMTDETIEYELDGDELIFEDDSVWTFTYSNGKIYILSVEEDGETTELSKGDFVLEK